MENSSGSYFSSWSASENYGFAATSLESFAGEGSMLPSSYFMDARSDHNFEFNKHEQNSSMLINECFKYNAEAGLLSGEISKDKHPNGLLELQQLQSSSNQQSNLVNPGVVQQIPAPGIFHPQLDTPSLAELPHTLSSSIDSNGSDVSAFLTDVHAVSSASNLCTTYENGSSFMEPANLESFSFGGAQNGAMLSKKGYPDGNFSVFDNAALAALHDSKEFTSSKVPSFATMKETNLAAGGFKTQKQEQNAVYDAPIPTLIPDNQMAVTATQGTLMPPKMSSLTGENKSKCPVSHPSGVQTQTNSTNGNVVGVKPRVRARRGQATDPHSIAERLRREKISDRMKNLQDLVPNSNKTDKASMLDEIIDYVKFLQLQVKVLSMSRLGAPGAVLPVLSESQIECCSDQPLITPTTAQGLPIVQDSEDTLAFEQEVVKLMETSITSAMQYLQNKGLCLMPVALASAVSNQKGMDTSAIAPQR